MAYVSLHDRLKGPIPEALKKALKRTNVHSLPQLEKVVISVGINKMKMDSPEMQEYILESLSKITGQKPVLTKARKAISNFKTREGVVVGATVTLRGQRMEEFLDRFLSYGLPRVRDFRGLRSKCDGQGNYCIGIRDHSIFPEVPPPDARQIFGLQVNIKTTAETDEEAMALLQELGVPFRREEAKETESKGLGAGSGGLRKDKNEGEDEKEAEKAVKTKKDDENTEEPEAPEENDDSPSS